jgi:cytochrome bd-type quinol oxidase subunit 2
MGLAEISALATAVFFAIYGVACGIECGVAVNLLTDKKMAGRRYFTPLWEVTNVFLVFGVTAVAMLFNNVLESLSSVLFSTLVVGLTALILRACIVLTIFYWRPDKLPRWLAWSFAITCFTIPLSFAAAGAYLLTGQLFWNSFTGWIVMASAFLGILSIGMSTIKTERKSDFPLPELIFTGWMVILGSVLPLVAKISYPGLQKLPLALLSLLCIGGLGYALAAITNSNRKLWHYAVVIGFSAPLLLAWACRPFLIYGKATLETAFSAGSYAGAFLVGTAIIFPLIILGFWLFYKLLRQPA